MKYSCASLFLLCVTLLNIMSQETSISFQEYKNFIFYTRDSIARYYLSLSFDDYSTHSDSTESINWDVTIDYRDEEINWALTNFCWYYENDHPFNYSNQKLIFKKEYLVYSNSGFESVNIFPAFNNLELENSVQLDTNLSITNSWNKNYNDLDITTCLTIKQISAFQHWKNNSGKEIAKKLRKTYVPKTINMACDSTYDSRSRLNRKIVKKGYGKYEIIYYTNENEVVLIGNYNSIFPEVKDGEYLFYNKGKIKTKGFYKNNLPDGIWIQYENDSTINREIDYSFQNIPRKANNENEQSYSTDQFDSPPNFKSSEYKNLEDYFASNFFYPPYADYEIQLLKNKVIMEISEVGLVTDIKIIEGSSNEFNYEVMRLLYLTKWIPATKNGRPVPVQLVFDFNY